MRRVRLLLIADAPTVPAQALLTTLAAVFEAVDPRALMIVDRDLAEAPDRPRLARLRRLRAITAAAGAQLTVTGRLDLAWAVGADGVQLPEHGLPLAAAKRILPPGIGLGRSCHDARGLAEAEAGGADWATLSPIRHPICGKATSQQPLGVAGFAARVAGRSLPVYALGGVDPSLASPLHAAGAAGIASIGALFGATDPRTVARDLMAPWRNAKRV